MKAGSADIAVRLLENADSNVRAPNSQRTEGKDGKKVFVKVPTGEK